MSNGNVVSGGRAHRLTIHDHWLAEFDRSIGLEWFARSKGDAPRAKLLGIGGVGHVYVGVVLGDDFHGLKTGSAHGADELCFQQSASNSTRP